MKFFVDNNLSPQPRAARRVPSRSCCGNLANGYRAESLALREQIRVANEEDKKMGVKWIRKHYADKLPPKPSSVPRSPKRDTCEGCGRRFEPEELHHGLCRGECHFR